MNQKILRLALPNIISNITVPLLGMVDLAIVGHLEMTEAIGAISLATMIFNFIYWNMGFLRMGTSGFTAQANGSRNFREATAIIVRSLTVAIIIAFFIVVFHPFILGAAFVWIQSSELTLKYASVYFNIYIWAAPAILCQYALTGWLIGMQNAKTPMYVAIFVNMLNITLSLGLVYGFNMQLEGVATASLISQYAGLLCTLFIISWKYKRLFRFLDWSILKNVKSFIPFFRVNSDIFLRTLMLVIVTTFFTAQSAKSGDITLAVNTLLLQFFVLFSYFMDGFAYAAEALTGRYIGARNPSQLKLLIRHLFYWGVSIALIFTLIYGFFADFILSVLTDKELIINESKKSIVWILFIPICGFAAFLWDGIFIGATASRQMRNSMFCAVAIFFVSYYSLSALEYGWALWFSFLLYLTTRAIVQTIIAKSESYRLHF